MAFAPMSAADISRHVKVRELAAAPTEAYARIMEQIQAHREEMFEAAASDIPLTEADWDDRNQAQGSHRKPAGAGKPWQAHFCTLFLLLVLGSNCNTHTTRSLHTHIYIYIYYIYIHVYVCIRTCMYVYNVSYNERVFRKASKAEAFGLSARRNDPELLLREPGKFPSRQALGDLWGAPKTTVIDYIGYTSRMYIHIYVCVYI